MELPVSVEVSVVCASPWVFVVALSGIRSPGPDVLVKLTVSPTTGSQFSPSVVYSNVAVKMWLSPTTFVSLSGVRLSRTSIQSFVASSELISTEAPSTVPS